MATEVDRLRESRQSIPKLSEMKVSSADRLHYICTDQSIATASAHVRQVDGTAFIDDISVRSIPMASIKLTVQVHLNWLHFDRSVGKTNLPYLVFRGERSIPQRSPSQESVPDK